MFLRDVGIQETMAMMKTISFGRCEIEPLPQKVNIS